MNLYTPLFKNILFPFFEGAIKNRDTVPQIKMYQNNLSRSTEQLEEAQFNRLTSLLHHCQKTVPYYQRLFAGLGIERIEEDIKSLADYQKLPILTKDIIRANSEDLISSEHLNHNLIKSTGGSTGAPLRLELNPESEFSRTAVMYRGYGWLGAGLGVKTFYLWGASLGESTFLKNLKVSLHESFLNRKTVSSFDMHQSNLHEYVAKVNKYKPTAIVSYTNPLYQLAKFILINDIKMHSPTSIITGAEALSEYQRAVIEDAFKCKVYNSYGCREVMLIGAECKHQKGFHLNIDHLVVETVNNESQHVTDKTGDVVLTDLSNLGMPLLRYQNGDTGIISTRKCSCGNPLPIMEEVSGRKTDVIKTPSGGIIPGLFFPHLMKEYREIIKYQAKQSQLSSIELSIISDGRLQPSTVDSIKKEFNKIAEDVAINIREVSEIPLTPSGKHRNIICEI